MDNKISFMGKFHKYTKAPFLLSVNGVFISITCLVSPIRFKLYSFLIYIITAIVVYFTIKSIKLKEVQFVVEDSKLKGLTGSRVNFITNIDDVKFISFGDLDSSTSRCIYSKDKKYEFDCDKSDILKLNKFFSKYINKKCSIEEDMISCYGVDYLRYEELRSLKIPLIIMFSNIYIIGSIMTNYHLKSISFIIACGCMMGSLFINYLNITDVEGIVKNGDLKISRTSCDFNKTVDYNFLENYKNQGNVDAIYMKFNGDYYCEAYVLPNSITKININLSDCKIEFFSHHSGKGGMFVGYIPRNLTEANNEFIIKLKEFFPNASVNISNLKK